MQADFEIDLMGEARTDGDKFYRATINFNSGVAQQLNALSVKAQGCIAYVRRHGDPLTSAPPRELVDHPKPGECCCHSDTDGKCDGDAIDEHCDGEADYRPWSEQDQPT